MSMMSWVLVVVLITAVVEEAWGCSSKGREADDKVDGSKSESNSEIYIDNASHDGRDHAIVGGIAGVVIGLVLLVAGYCCLRRMGCTRNLRREARGAAPSNNTVVPVSAHRGPEKA